MPSWLAIILAAACFVALGFIMAMYLGRDPTVHQPLWLFPVTLFVFAPALGFGAWLGYRILF